MRWLTLRHILFDCYIDCLPARFRSDLMHIDRIRDCLFYNLLSQTMQVHVQIQLILFRYEVIWPAWTGPKGMASLWWVCFEFCLVVDGSVLHRTEISSIWNALEWTRACVRYTHNLNPRGRCINPIYFNNIFIYYLFICGLFGREQIKDTLIDWKQLYDASIVIIAIANLSVFIISYRNIKRIIKKTSYRIMYCLQAYTVRLSNKSIYVKSNLKLLIAYLHTLIVHKLIKITIWERVKMK